MSWLILIIAGCMEVAFTFCLGKTKTADGAELFWWWGGFVVALTLSMVLMAKAAQTIPIGTVYPVWTGIGAVGAVLVGIFFFHGTGHLLEDILYHDFNIVDNRFESYLKYEDEKIQTADTGGGSQRNLRNV